MSLERYYYNPPCGCQTVQPCGCLGAGQPAQSEACVPIIAADGVIIERHVDTNGNQYLLAKPIPVAQEP